MIEIIFAVALIVIVKHLFKSKSVNHELIEAKLTNSEFRANKRNFK